MLYTILSSISIKGVLLYPYLSIVDTVDCALLNPKANKSEAIKIRYFIFEVFLCISWLYNISLFQQYLLKFESQKKELSLKEKKSSEVRPRRIFYIILCQSYFI